MDNEKNGVQSPVVHRSENLSVTNNQSYQRKSGLSLRWEDFFGSNSDLSSSVEQGWQTLTSTDIDLDIDGIEASPCKSRTNLDSSQTHLLSSINIPVSRCNNNTVPLPLSNSSASLIARRANQQEDSVESNLHLSGCSTVPGYGPASQKEEKFGPLTDHTDYECQDNFISSGTATKRPLSYVSSTSSSSSSLPRRPSERKKFAVGVPTDSCPEEISLDSDCEDQVDMTKLEVERQITLTAEPTDDEAAKKDRVFMVVEELIETEVAYIKSLEEVNDGYIGRIRQEKICDENTINAIFSNLTKLYSFHNCFLEELLSSEMDIVRVSNWFINNAELFQSLYGDYCTNFSDSMQQLDETRRLNHRLWEFLLSCQQSLQHQLPLATYLLKPVQRILKYQLLLQELCKSLLKSDQANLVGTVKMALGYMANVADAINERKRANENAQRVAKLRNHLKESSADLDVDGLGDLVLDGEFRLPGKKDPRYVLLFHKAILVTKRLDTNFIAVKHVIHCTNLMLIESINKDPLAFHVMPFDNPKCQQTLLASSQEIKHEWCHYIKQLIIENYDAAIPEKAKQIVLNMADIMPGMSAQKSAPNESGEAPMPKPPRKSNGTATLTRRHSEVTSPTGEFLTSSGVDLSFNGVEMRRRDSGTNLSSSPRPGSKTLELNEFDKMWSELKAKHSHADVMSVVTPGHEDNPSSVTCSPGSVVPDTIPTTTNTPFFDDDDFRCIAVEINEERSDYNHFINNNSSTSSASAAPPQTSGKIKGHSRNNSRGSVKFTGGSFSTNVSSDHDPTSGTDFRRTTNNTSSSPSRCNATSLYIDCSQENYDKVTFGRAYYQYIEKTRTQIELTATDIDEIFQPLKLAFTEEEKHVPTPPPSSASPQHQKSNTPEVDDDNEKEEDEEGSSGGSSPRHIISRIAVHKRKPSAPVTPNVIQISTVGRAEGRSLNKGSASPPHNNRPSLFSSSLTKRESNTKKSLSNHHDLSDNVSKPWLPRPNSNNSLDGSVPSSGKSNLVQRFFRAYSRNSKRDKKSAETPATATTEEDSASLDEVSVMSQSSSKEDMKPLANSTSRESIKNTPPSIRPPRPGDTPCGHGTGTLSRKKNRAPPPPPPSIVTASPSTPSAQQNISDTSEQNSAVSDLDVCRGRVKNAMKTLIESDNIPYADDVAGSPPSVKLSGVSSGSSSTDALSPRLNTTRVSNSNNIPNKTRLAPAPPLSSSTDPSPAPPWSQQTRTLKKAPAPSPPTTNNVAVQRSASLSQPLKPPRRFQNASASKFDENDAAPNSHEPAKLKRPVNLTSSSSFSSGKCGQEINSSVSRCAIRTFPKTQEVNLTEEKGPAPETESEPEALPPRGLVKSMMNKFQ